MPNIMITERCNLSCPYCFADEQMAGREMSAEDFKQVLETFRSWGVEHVGIIGGEPMLHSNFEQIMGACIKSDIPSFTLFTNGTRPLSPLAAHRKFGILLNFNSRSVMGDARYDEMVENILTYHRIYAAGNLSLGLNVYHPDVEQAGDLLYTAKLLELKKVRLSLSVPTHEYLSKHSITEYFMGLKQTYLDLCRMYDTENIALHQDCNYIPACIFNDAERAELMNLSRKYSERLRERVCYINSEQCNPVIDVTCDKRLIRCFGMSETGAELSGFRSISQVKAYFVREIDRYASLLNIREQCGNCEIPSFCNMGCLRAKSHRLAGCRELCAVLNGGSK